MTTTYLVWQVITSISEIRVNHILTHTHCKYDNKKHWEET